MVITLDHALFKEISESVRDIYGDNLVSVIVYGSVARNTATEESDIDIAIMVKKDDADMYDKWLDVVVKLDLEYDQVITTSLIEEKKFDEWKDIMPYYKNIQKEGVVLWNVA